MPFNVPLYEELEAMVYANYNYREWRDLDYTEKAMSVAHYRFHKLIKLHGDDAVADQMDREMKKRKK